MAFFSLIPATSVTKPRNPPGSLRGAIFLLAATALWGSTVVVIKQIGLRPGMINFSRFALACAALGFFARRGRLLWLAGLELGLWLFVAYASQAVGLKHTTVNRSAFITAMNVIFVPILSRLIGRKISPLVWAAAITAVIGCGLLCYDGKPPNIGDLWTILTAITWAAYIVRVESSAKAFSALSLAIAQLVPIMLLSFGWAAAEHSIRAPASWVQAMGILYLGLPATAGTTWLQAAGQRLVPAAQAAVIFTLEPVFAAICGYLWLHEKLGVQGMIGAGMIVMAALMSQMPALISF